MQRTKLILLGFLIAIALTACGGGGGSSDKPPPEREPSNSNWDQMNWNEANWQ